MASWLEKIKFEVNHNVTYRELAILENSWFLTIVKMKGDVRNMLGWWFDEPLLVLTQTARLFLASLLVNKRELRLNSLSIDLDPFIFSS